MKNFAGKINFFSCELLLKKKKKKRDGENLPYASNLLK